MFLKERVDFVSNLHITDKPKLNPIGRHIMLAIQRIQKRGWCQGSCINLSGNNCILGAIYRHDYTDSFDDIKYSSEAWIVVQEYIGPISVWNDKPGRTQEEVIAKLTEIALTQTE